VPMGDRFTQARTRGIVPHSFLRVALSLVEAQRGAVPLASVCPKHEESFTSEGVPGKKEKGVISFVLALPLLPKGKTARNLAQLSAA